MGIEGLTEITFPTSFEDDRGIYHEIINSSLMPKFTIKQVSIVTNERNVVRGMHGDWGTSKIVTVISGKVLQVCLDCRPQSLSYGSVYQRTISALDTIAVFIPNGVANGFKVLEGDTKYLYLQNTFYGDYPQFTVFPFVPDLAGVFGDKNKCIISERDNNSKNTLNKIRKKI